MSIPKRCPPPNPAFCPSQTPLALIRLKMVPFNYSLCSTTEPHQRLTIRQFSLNKPSPPSWLLLFFFFTPLFLSLSPPRPYWRLFQLVIYTPALIPQKQRRTIRVFSFTINPVITILVHRPPPNPALRLFQILCHLIFRHTLSTTLCLRRFTELPSGNRELNEGVQTWNYE